MTTADSDRVDSSGVDNVDSTCFCVAHVFVLVKVLEQCTRIAVQSVDSNFIKKGNCKTVHTCTEQLDCAGQSGH